MIKTSERAWSFARRVTGVGFSKEEIVSDDKKPKGDKWDQMVREIEAEEAQQNPVDPQVQMLNELKSKMGNPKEALDIITGVKSLNEDDPLDTSNADKEDYSAYFKANTAMGGCAHDRSKERALYNRPTSEKLEMAARFRLEGNDFFAQKNFKVAAVHYQKALLYYEYTFPDNPEEEAILHKDKLAAHLNLAAANLNLKAYRDCISQCYQATQMDKDCSKAWFRMGQAHLSLDEFDKAEEYLQKAYDLSKDPAAAKAIRQCHRQRLEWKRQAPDMYKKMLAEASSAIEEESPKIGPLSEAVTQSSPSCEAVPIPDDLQSPVHDAGLTVSSEGIDSSAVEEDTDTESFDARHHLQVDSDKVDMDIDRPIQIHEIKDEDKTIIKRKSILKREGSTIRQPVVLSREPSLRPPTSREPSLRPPSMKEPSILSTHREPESNMKGSETNIKESGQSDHIRDPGEMRDHLDTDRSENVPPILISRLDDSESDSVGSPIQRAAERTQAFLLSEPCTMKERRASEDSWWHLGPKEDPAVMKVAVSGFLLGAILATTIAAVVIGICAEVRSDNQRLVSADLVQYAMAVTVPVVGLAAFLTGRQVLVQR